MKKNVQKYIEHHRQATICEIGAFRDQLAYKGIDLSYEMCFGLSASMCFVYGKNQTRRPLLPDYYLPTYMASPIIPLSFGLNNLCRAANVWTKTSRTCSKEKFKKILHENINENRPVLVEVESMQYFNMLGIPSFSVELAGSTKFAIGGHMVTVVGYDDEKGTVEIIDNFIRSSVHLDEGSFVECCTNTASYAAPEGEWTVFYVPPKIMPLDYMIYHSIYQLAHYMDSSFTTKTEDIYGLRAMKKFFADFPNWEKELSPDKYKISLLLLYNFERMEPTRGFYRKLYCNFLSEAISVTHKSELKNVICIYEETHVLWKEFAQIILELINSSVPEMRVFEKIGDRYRVLTESILEKETKAVKQLQTIIQSW